jgi:glucosamine 6-phosphate synthetase-like amidotransferase/phosphosugar isomerase protein
MCGIFGFALKERVPATKVFTLLEKLEGHQYPQESKPIGGYGAGVATLEDNGSVVLEKIGKIDVSPARYLVGIVKFSEASILIGHVRMPSEEFMGTARFRETAQPYFAHCQPDLAVVSAHNGYVANYKEIKEKLVKEHVFESEKVGLIDSEVIPHFFEQKMMEKANPIDALDAVFSSLEGSGAVSLLQIEEEDTFLHIFHKGKTRGLTVWTNEQDEAIFCSRKEPLIAEFGDILVEGRFKEKVSIPWREDASLKLTFRVKG